MGSVRSHWAWGTEDRLPGRDELRATGELLASVLGFGGPGDLAEPAAIEQVRLPGPRLSPPAALAAICSADRRDRAAHAHGHSYRDLVRAFRGQFDHVPDVDRFVNPVSRSRTLSCTEDSFINPC